MASAGLSSAGVTSRLEATAGKLVEPTPRPARAASPREFFPKALRDVGGWFPGDSMIKILFANDPDDLADNDLADGVYFSGTLISFWSLRT